MQTITLGDPVSGPDEPGADTLYEGFVKVNTNFSELYSGLTPEYTVATLPSAASNDNVTIIVSDDADGRILATSDAISWKRASNGLVVSATVPSPTSGEYTSDGTLVYPYSTSQTPTYNTDNTIDYISTSYASKTWTLTNTYTNGLITLMTATDGITSWTKTISYTSGVITTEGDWV